MSCEEKLHLSFSLWPCTLCLLDYFFTRCDFFSNAFLRRVGLFSSHHFFIIASFNDQTLQKQIRGVSWSYRKFAVSISSGISFMAQKLLQDHSRCLLVLILDYLEDECRRIFYCHFQVPDWESSIMMHFFSCIFLSQPYKTGVLSFNKKERLPYLLYIHIQIVR